MAGRLPASRRQGAALGRLHAPVSTLQAQCLPQALTAAEIQVNCTSLSTARKNTQLIIACYQIGARKEREPRHNIICKYNDLFHRPKSLKTSMSASICIAESTQGRGMPYQLVVRLQMQGLQPGLLPGHPEGPALGPHQELTQGSTEDPVKARHNAHCKRSKIPLGFTLVSIKNENFSEFRNSKTGARKGAIINMLIRPESPETGSSASICRAESTQL